jgi:iron complex outermembrane receptor protein
MFLRVIGASMAACIVGAPAFAQQTQTQQTQNQLSTSAIALDDIVVTAARADRKVSDTPATVYVVDRATIEKQLQFENSASALLSRTVPGYSVSNETFSGASESFRGRDLLVMLDGVPLNTPLRDVSRVLSLIDLNSVERVEVVAGASSLYGAGATGGTANFITKRATDGTPRLTTNTSVRAFTADVGSSLRPEASASLTGKAPNGWDYVMVGTGRFANKTYDGAGRELPSDQFLGQGGGDRYSNASFLGKFGYDFADGKRFELQGAYFYLNQQPAYLTTYGPPYAQPNFLAPYTGQDVGENTATFSTRYTDANFALGNLSLLGFYNNIDKSFPYSVLDPRFNSVVYYSGNIANPTAPYNQTTLKSQRGGVNVTIDTPLDAIIRGSKFTWGFDFVDDSTRQQLSNGEDVFNPMSQRSYAGFGQLQIPLGERVMLRGGMRYEHFDLKVDDFVRPLALLQIGNLFAVLPNLPVQGGQFNYGAPTFNFGGTYKLTPNLEVHASFSQGYSLPDVGAYTRRAGLNFPSTAQAIPYTCGINNPTVCTTNRSISYAMLGLEPQIVESQEIGLRWSGDVFRGNIVAFVSRSDKGVNFDPASNTIAQQKEKISGVEGTGEVTINPNLNVGTVLAYREGRVDTNKDGILDSYLQNNRISTPFHGTIYSDIRFDNGAVLRLEGMAFSGRDRKVNLAGDHYKLESAQTMNVSLSVPLWDGTAYIGVQNLFDETYQNPTATATRQFAPDVTNPVYAFGRTVSVGYRKTW